MTRPLSFLGHIYLILMASSVSAEPLAPAQESMQVREVSLSSQIIDLTLSDAVFLSLRDNRLIRSAYLERIAQKFDLQVAEDQFNPKLVLSARHLAYRNQNDHYRQSEIIPQTTLQTQYGTKFSLSWSNQLTQANQAGRARNDGATFSVIQPLLRGAGRDVTTAPVRLARLNEATNRLRLKSTVSDTVTQVISAYREFLRAREQLQISQEALLRSRKLLEANKAMIQAGRMAAFDAVQTEADVATQELGVEEANNQLDTSRLELLRLLALDLGTQIRAVDALEATRIELGLGKAITTALENQPAYLSELIAAEQAEINLKRAVNDKLWDVSLVGGITQVRDRYPGNVEQSNSRTWEGYTGVQVDIPIGDLSRRQAEVRARVDAENQRIRMADSRQLLERDVGNSVRDLDTRWRQYQISQRARDLSQRKLEIEREKLQAGRSSNFQVLSFEADLRNAESARLNALIAYLNAQSVLDRTLGTTLKSWDIDLND